MTRNAADLLAQVWVTWANPQGDPMAMEASLNAPTGGEDLVIPAAGHHVDFPEGTSPAAAVVPWAKAHGVSEFSLYYREEPLKVTYTGSQWVDGDGMPLDESDVDSALYERLPAELADVMS